VKPWWQSKTIIGIVTLLLAFLAERFSTGISQEEIGNVVTLGAGLLGAVLAIVGRLTAKKELRVTVPGGKFNPNAEVRKPKGYKFPKTGGYYELPSAWAGVAWLLAAGLFFALASCFQHSRASEMDLSWQAPIIEPACEINVSEMLARRDAMLADQPAPEIRFCDVVDARPFLVRLLDSITVTPSLRGSTNSPAYTAELYISGGTDF
jgi:hypothetical protein